MLETVAPVLKEPQFYIGQIVIRKTEAGFVLCHRADLKKKGLRIVRSVEAAADLPKYDEAGNFRPLKTAPNLCRGWQLEVGDLSDVQRSLDFFYPGRLAVFAAWKQERLQLTPLRETLNRQTGMYRVAAKISDDQIEKVVAGFCRSDGGCLRTILWKRDANGASPSSKLPGQKFDPGCDQASLTRSDSIPIVPLLCQEACNLLVAECRKVVKTE